jgi:hypothetical protein
MSDRISFQVDRQIDWITEGCVTSIIQAIPVGLDGIKFNGGLSNGIIVNHRAEGVWTVSFRPSPNGRNSRRYASPSVAARVVITGQHDVAAALD